METKCRFKGSSPFVIDCNCQDCTRQAARVTAKALPEYHELVDSFREDPLEYGHIHVIPAPGQPCVICDQRIL